MKNLLMTLIVIFNVHVFGQSSFESAINEYKQKFDSLPELSRYNNQGQYSLLVDTLNQDDQSSYHVAGRLYYNQNMIWQTDSTNNIYVYGDGDVLLLGNSIVICRYVKYILFYRGEDITKMVRPNGFPEVSEIRFSGKLIYLCYYDYGSFRRHEGGRYASYDLETGILKTD